jgi:hypothetical protein
MMQQQNTQAITQAMTEMEAAALAPTALQITIKPTELEWIIDSGATHHMTPLRQAFDQHLITQQKGRNDQKHRRVDDDEDAHRYDSMTVMMGSQQLVNPIFCN